MMRKILVAPSILSADFTRLGEEICRVESAGADWLHIDVMDGHFVPNITIGPLVVKDARKVTGLTIESHLMISEPEKYIDAFAEAGSDVVTFHIESCRDPEAIIGSIKSYGIKAAVSVKPKTGIDSLKEILHALDMVLIMTVEPGFGGQAFMKECVSKIESLRKIYPGDIAVDGGITPETSKIAVEAGANILVAGTAVFKKSDYKKAIQDLKGGK